MTEKIPKHRHADERRDAARPSDLEAQLESFICDMDRRFRFPSELPIYKSCVRVIATILRCDSILFSHKAIDRANDWRYRSCSLLVIHSRDADPAPQSANW